MSPVNRDDDVDIIPSDSMSGIPLPPSLLLVVLTFAMCGMLLVVLLLCRLLTVMQRRKKSLKLKIEKTVFNKNEDMIEKVKDVSKAIIQCCHPTDELSSVGNYYDELDDVISDENTTRVLCKRLEYDENSNYCGFETDVGKVKFDSGYEVYAT